MLTEPPETSIIKNVSGKTGVFQPSVRALTGCV